MRTRSGWVRIGQGGRLGTRRRLPDDLVAPGPEERRDAVPEQRVIVGQEDPHRTLAEPAASAAGPVSGSASTGIVRRTVVPAGPDRHSTRPPTPAARSRIVASPSRCGPVAARRPVAAAAGSNPRPSSSTSTTSQASSTSSRTTTRCAAACLRTLVRASRTIRNTSSSIAGSIVSRTAASVASTRTASFDASANRRAYTRRAAAETATGGDRPAQPQDRLADVDVERARRGRQLAELAAGLGKAAGRQELVDGLGLGVDVAEHLGQAVVQLAGDPLALAAHGEVAQLELEPVGLDRDRGLAGERCERAAVVLGGRSGRVADDGQRPERLVAAQQWCLEQRPGRRRGAPAEAVDGRDLRRIGRAAPRPEPQVAVGVDEPEQGDFAGQQPAGIVDDRPEDLVEVGDGGDRDAHLVQGPG